MGHRRHVAIRAHDRGYPLTNDDETAREEIYRDDLSTPDSPWIAATAQEHFRRPSPRH